MQYEKTLSRVETYFDKTATKTWERLTSDAPVSWIRQTVREGRDAMRDKLLSRLPKDIRGARILDAGCGAGQITEILANAGAEVVAVDISPSLIDVAKRRITPNLHEYIDFRVGDLRDHDLGHFDHVIAMDSLIYYQPSDLSAVMANLAARTRQGIYFTVAPKTALLMMMWYAGKLAPRSDRSPVMHPHSVKGLTGRLSMHGKVQDLGRVHRGFYISQALEVSL